MENLLPETLTVWLLNYGSFALFGLLALGIIALPIPEETLMVFAGILISKGTLSLLPTVLSAYLGSICGITVSYLIGITGGLYILKKYGKYVGVTEPKLLTAHNWFEYYGKWVLVIGYFVPGLRHFSGVFAGVSYMEYPHFALYAYSGAILWASTFLSIGYFFGNCCQSVYELIESNVELALTLFTICVLLAIWFRFRMNKQAK